MLTPFLKAIQLALNQYLSLDTQSKKRLEKLSGQIASITLIPFNFSFQIEFTHHGVNLHAGNELTADLSLSGSPLALFALANHNRDWGQSLKKDISMMGNPELAQEIMLLFSQLDIDWESHLANLIGDVPTYHLYRGKSVLSNWLKKSGESLSFSMKEYIYEEANWFPSKECLNDFFLAVDQLRMSSDRLEARIHMLEKIIKQKGNQ